MSDEPVRPAVHFTPPAGWMNDPNGLVSIDGAHHLYFQHHPHSTEFGAMHWGHAVSRDFVSWDHLPTALAPDEHGLIFSGSAVVDCDNSAGFGTGAVVAAFTYHDDARGNGDRVVDSQAIAWSNDHGLTFTKFPGNPVIPVDDDRRLSRDPKVFRHRDHWVMVLSTTKEIRIFTSGDLRSWELTDAVVDLHPLGMPLETPDLFPLAADDGTRHWVLTAGVARGAPAGGSGTAMLLGQFDGRRFRGRGAPRWVDHGASFYAAQSWNGVPNERRVWIGWMSSWVGEAPPAPSAPWRGQMSVARELTLRAVGDDYVVEQRPVHELAGRLCTERFTVDSHDTVRSSAAQISMAVGADRDVRLIASRTDSDAVIAIDRSRGELTVEIPHAVAGYGPATGLVRRAALPPVDIDLVVVVDAASIEVFAGPVVVTDALAFDPGEWTVETAGES